MRLFFLRTAGATTLFFLVTITIFYFGKDLFKNGNTIGASSSVEKNSKISGLAPIYFRQLTKDKDQNEVLYDIETIEVSTTTIREDELRTIITNNSNSYAHYSRLGDRVIFAVLPKVTIAPISIFEDMEGSYPHPTYTYSDGGKHVSWVEYELYVTDSMLGDRDFNNKDQEGLIYKKIANLGYDFRNIIRLFPEESIDKGYDELVLLYDTFESGCCSGESYGYNALIYYSKGDLVSKRVKVNIQKGEFPSILSGLKSK